ncbi:MAG: substrate-binding domain-containing protein [Mesorhizobium sp.]|nr:substrate-binding domain-containing protein [Mesorhizobium sp.]
MRSLGMSAAVLGMLAALATPDSAFAGTLRIGGTGAVTEGLIQLAPAFEAETGVRLEVIPSLGTGGANAAVADGVIGMSVAGRDLKDSEAARGLIVAGALRTPFGLATSRPGPDNIASGDVAGLYRDLAPVWPDGAPVLIVLRPVDESDNQVLGRLFPGMADAVAQARLRPDLTVAATDQDNVDMAETTPGSLVSATLLQIASEKRDLRFVAIDGVAPSLRTYLDGTYPYGKTLYLVVAADLSPEAAAFLAFVASPAAEPLLREAGVVMDRK